MLIIRLYIITLLELKKKLLIIIYQKSSIDNKLFQKGKKILKIKFPQLFLTIQSNIHFNTFSQPFAYIP